VNIYMAGVGGQGIGLLSEVLLRTCSHAGMTVKGVDTHGLAQRGGIVVSHLRTGGNILSPMTVPGEVDLVLALERHEAHRACVGQLRDGGALAWYDAVWQPWDVRSGLSRQTSPEDLEGECARRGIRALRVLEPALPDARMQNTVLLAAVMRAALIPGIDGVHVEMALEDLLAGSALKANLELFRSRSAD
jgi:indolepyruvate ferredoxin oxidoreductase, beta subunit